MDKKLIVKSQNLDLQVNVDGLPLFNSSHLGLWPILVKVTNIASKSIIPVSLFCGVGKPEVTKYLRPFVDEIRALKVTGILYKNIHLQISNLLFVCDSPARSYIQGTKGHSGYRSCPYCRENGEYHQKRMIFPSITETHRTDEDYHLGAESNQLFISPLRDITLLRSSFPPDAMHIIYLGIVRKLLHYYFSPNKGRILPCRISTGLKDLLSQKVLSLRKYIPSEFQRKPRPFNELEHFKATELRTYLLYLGPVVFNEVLNSAYYEHFLLLHFAVYVYSAARHDLYDCADSCIINFIAKMSDLFGRECDF